MAPGGIGARLSPRPNTALATTRDELFRLQLGQYTNQVTSTAALTSKRRDIARILTVLNGRKLGLEKQAGKASK